MLRDVRKSLLLTIRQRGRVVYEGEARIDYLLIDNEAELSHCFSIHSHLTKTQTVNDNETRTNETKNLNVFYFFI